MPQAKALNAYAWHCGPHTRDTQQSCQVKNSSRAEHCQYIYDDHTWLDEESEMNLSFKMVERRRTHRIEMLMVDRSRVWLLCSYPGSLAVVTLFSAFLVLLVRPRITLYISKIHLAKTSDPGQGGMGAAGILHLGASSCHAVEERMKEREWWLSRQQ